MFTTQTGVRRPTTHVRGRHHPSNLNMRRDMLNIPTTVVTTTHPTLGVTIYIDDRHYLPRSRGLSCKCTSTVTVTLSDRPRVRRILCTPVIVNVTTHSVRTRVRGDHHHPRDLDNLEVYHGNLPSLLIRGLRSNERASNERASNERVSDVYRRRRRPWITLQRIPLVVIVYPRQLWVRSLLHIPFRSKRYVLKIH